MANPSANTHKINLLAKAIALVGAGLFCIGLVWPMFETQANHWSAEQAAEYSSASRALHQSASKGHDEHDHDGHNHASESETEAEDLKQAQQRFETISQELESARAAPQVMAGRMKLVGGVLLLVGAAAMPLARAGS